MAACLLNNPSSTSLKLQLRPDSSSTTGLKTTSLLLLPTRVNLERNHNEGIRHHSFKCRLTKVKESPSSNPSTLLKEPHKYFDQVIITVRSGDGGHGAIISMPEQKAPPKTQRKHAHGHQEKKKKSLCKRDSDGSLILPMRGHGGDVIIYADEGSDSLLEFHRKSRHNAKRGGNVDAMGVLTSQLRDGFAAPTLRIPVPVGTVVKSKRGMFLADLAHPGDEILVAKAEQGGGLPNAGKSTLLGATTLAKPEIANYPFTTLIPNLGRLGGDPSLGAGKYSPEATLSDVPGLVEGAHLGKDLGRNFLRHLRRTQLLVHIVDAAVEDPVKDYRTVKEILHSPTPSSLSYRYNQPSLNPKPKSISSFLPSSFPSKTLIPSSLTLHRRKSNLLRCASSSFPHEHHTSGPPQSDDAIELPLFPLPLVLFPGAILPLQIFEFRYRMMMHTLLQTDLRFGVIYSDPATGTADVGCVGEVIKHERLVDDRFFLICKGQERFRVSKLVRTKPYLVAQVTWLEDKPSADGDDDLDALATEVETYMKDVIRLSNRLNGKPEKEAQDLRRNLFPTPFSFFVGSTFEGAPREQQALLELEETATRLKREKETLRNTLNYLTAASAVKDVFPSS